MSEMEHITWLDKTTVNSPKGLALAAYIFYKTGKVLLQN